jgi:hypothetical protein
MQSLLWPLAGNLAHLLAWQISNWLAAAMVGTQVPANIQKADGGSKAISNLPAAVVVAHTLGMYEMWKTVAVDPRWADHLHLSCRYAVVQGMNKMTGTERGRDRDRDRDRGREQESVRERHKWRGRWSCRAGRRRHLSPPRRDDGGCLALPSRHPGTAPVETAADKLARSAAAAAAAASAAVTRERDWERKEEGVTGKDRKRKRRRERQGRGDRE